MDPFTKSVGLNQGKKVANIRKNCSFNKKKSENLDSFTEYGLNISTKSKPYLKTLQHERLGPRAISISREKKLGGKIS